MGMRIRTMAFIALLIAGFFASREASLRGQQYTCFACTGIFGETCEPCEGGEDCAMQCRDESDGYEGCTIFGLICFPMR